MTHITKVHCILSVAISIALSGLPATSGCSSSSDSDSNNGGGSGGGSGSGSGSCAPLAAPATPGIIPIIHTGYNGTDEFVGPILGNFTADAWSIADGSIGAVEAFGDCNLFAVKPNPITERFAHVVAIVHPQKSGESKVTAKISGQEFTVNVSVANYTAAAVALGKKRYYEPDNPSATRKACSSCHQVSNGPDHSPPAVAFFDDAVIRTIATQGTMPACITPTTGSGCTCGEQNCYAIAKHELDVPGGHKWEFTAAELDAIVPYLRSLPLRQR